MNKITKAVNELPPQYPVTKVSVDKFYGATKYDQFGFITRENYNRGNYGLRCTNLLTNGNGWDYHNSPELSKTINLAISSGWTVYEFNTFHELMSWILNNEKNSETVDR